MTWECIKMDRDEFGYVSKSTPKLTGRWKIVLEEGRRRKPDLYLETRVLFFFTFWVHEGQLEIREVFENKC